MKHIKTLNTQTLNNTVKKGGCGECQTSCQSACKTSCTVGNQTCENRKQKYYGYKKTRGKAAVIMAAALCLFPEKERYFCDTSVSEQRI